MKINSINNQSFGARADSTTKNFLCQMEKEYIDTKPITDIINKIYVGGILSTKISPSGGINMDIYDKNGDLQSKIVARDNDELSVDYGTYVLKDVKKFAICLYEALKDAAQKRSDEQKIYDKVNNQLKE